MKPTPIPQVEISHVDFANEVLHNRRAAVGLTVEQIQQLASAVIVLDHDFIMMREQVILMMAETAKEDASGQGPAGSTYVSPADRHVAVPIPRDLHENPVLAKAIVDFVRASDELEQSKYGPDEGQARNALEKQCAALAAHFRPKIRTGKEK